MISMHGIAGYVSATLNTITCLNNQPIQDALVKQVASVNKNTIVVVNSVGPILVEAWIDNPNGEHLFVNVSSANEAYYPPIQSLHWFVIRRAYT